MKDVFEIARGSVAGTRHVKAGKNNQDASVFKIIDNYAIMAIVCDGCSAGSHSEVGAKIGASMAIDSLFFNLAEWGTEWESVCTDFFWIRLKDRILSKLSHTTRSMDEECNQAVGDYFLFTMVGALILPEATAIFSIGDGVISINGKPIEIGPFPNNQPPYLAYGLLDQSLTGFSPKELRFKVHSIMPTREIQTILIGTDGVMDLIRSENEKIPGKEEVVGPLSQFWENGLYFRNSDALRRRLAVLNRESAKIDWEKREVKRENGLLPDDTTFVVIRRKKIGDYI